MPNISVTMMSKKIHYTQAPPSKIDLTQLDKSIDRIVPLTCFKATLEIAMSLVALA